MFLKKAALSDKRPRLWLRYLPVSRITRGADLFAAEDERLKGAMACGISQFGLLHPLLVRRSDRGYELVSGARRLEALKLAKVKRAMCLVMHGTQAEACAMRLLENLHRHEPDFLETAQALYQLIHDHGFSIEQAAAFSGLTVQDVTAKMRILKLPQRMLFALRDSGLTERHALALLRITSDETREAALCEMAYTDMGPEAAERYVDKLMRVRTPEEVPGQRPVYIVKDVRMFLNSISHGMDMMRGGGINAECVREDADNCIKLTIRIPERRIG